MIIENLTQPEIHSKIRLYRGDNSELGEAKFAYYKEMLAFEKEAENVRLINLIKHKLGTSYASGIYSAKEISTVLDMPVGKVKNIEHKLMRLLKSPHKSKHLKKYLLQGE